MNVNSESTEFLENTVKALSMLPFFNTQEDEKRLHACQLELKRRKTDLKTKQQVRNHSRKTDKQVLLNDYNKAVRKARNKG